MDKHTFHGAQPEDWNFSYAHQQQYQVEVADVQPWCSGGYPAVTEQYC